MRLTTVNLDRLGYRRENVSCTCMDVSDYEQKLAKMINQLFDSKLTSQYLSMVHFCRRKVLCSFVNR